MTELLHGVNASSFEQLRELSCDAIDAHQVSVVGPLQDELAADAGCFSNSDAALGGSTLLQKVVSSSNTSSDEFLGVNLADAFDLINLVSHVVCV